MNLTMSAVKKELQKGANPEKAAFFPSFFKTGKGQYGEGDMFIGATVPYQRSVARMFAHLPLAETKKLLYSKIHEHRLTALLILVRQFTTTTDRDMREKLATFYVDNMHRINNWDLVDLTAPNILGTYLLDKKRDILYKLAQSKNLWEKRIAIISTYSFIRQSDFKETLAIAEILLADTEDLIHKAVGWMLREVGKHDQKVEEAFLKKHYKTMPRTMLRYALEKFEPKKRTFYMKR